MDFYQKAWALRTINQKRTPISVWCLFGFVWLVYFAVFLTGINSSFLPLSFQRVTEGFLVFICVLFIGFSAIALGTKYYQCKELAMLAWRVEHDLVPDQQTKIVIRDIYKDHKENMAEKLLHEFKWWNFCVIFLQSAFLYVGEYYFIGTVLLICSLILNFIVWWERETARFAVEKIVTPDTMTWLE